MLYQSEIRKLPVLDISTGKILGAVCQVVFDHENKRLAGIGCSTWIWGTRQYIDREDIRGIGDHAVTISSAEVAKPLKEQKRLMALIKANIPFLGSRVITIDGQLLGVVEDYVLDPTHYHLAEFSLSDSLFQDILRGLGRVPAHCIIAIGRDAVVVGDNTLSILRPHKKTVPSDSVSESAVMTPEVDPELSGPPSQNVETLEPPAKPLRSAPQRPPLIVLSGKLSQQHSSHEHHRLPNVRYLRRIDEALGIKYPSPGHRQKQYSSLLMQVINRGKLWLDRTMHSKPPDSG